MSEKIEVYSHDEPCLVCGEETAVGSVFFFDRRVVEDPDGTRAYLCSSCIARIRAAGHHEALNNATSVGEVALIGLNLGGTH
jgi:alpha-D-ribose 1-methylphosphonate 5-phosphate C-P lyase